MNKRPRDLTTQTKILLRVFEGGVDVLREGTDPKTGALSRESLGWADLRNARLSDAARGKLTAEEIAGIEPRLRALRDGAESRDRSDALMLHGDINRARIWLEQASSRDVETVAEDLMFEMQEMRKLLIKRIGSSES